MADTWRTITFADNRLLAALFGEADQHLARIEERLGISIFSRGNVVSMKGESSLLALAERVLEQLYKQLEKGMDVDSNDVDAALRMLAPEREISTLFDDDPRLFTEEMLIKTPKKYVKPYTPMQQRYIELLYKHTMVFCQGPAGTGKTYLAVAVGVMMFLNRRVDRLILSRPALEAGEKIGFLPGDMKEKVDPYMRPLYDALYEMMGAERVIRLIESKEIEIAPLAFMRGRTLSRSFIIFDEAQNTTPAQMKMFLTRLGEGSRMVITGDLSQNDLPRGELSGLADAQERLANIPEIGFLRFQAADIVRHPLTAKIVEAYER